MISVQRDLREHTFFDGMEQEHLNLLQRIAHWERFRDGETLFEQGDPASSAYFVVHGTVAIHTQGPGGTELLLAKLGAGDVLGELSLIEQHRRNAGAMAQGELLALRIERSDLAALCAQYHPVSLQLLHRLALLLARRIRNSNSNSGGPEIAGGCREGYQPSELAAEHAGAAFNFRAFLPQLPFFRHFGARDIDHFVALCKVWTLPRARVIASAADEKRGCFVVVRGAAEKVVHRGTTRFRSGVLGPGTLFGEQGWLLQTPECTEVRSRESCTLLELPPDMLWELLDPNRHLSFRFHESMVRSLMTNLCRQTRAMARTEQKRQAGVQVWSRPG